MKLFPSPIGIPKFHKLYHYMRVLGITQTRNINDSDIKQLLHYNYSQDATFTLPDILKNKPCINKMCINVRKDHIESVFKDVFGYTSLVDPTVHKGYCVEKSVRNAVHNGKIIKCPINNIVDGNIYQRLIDNRIGMNSLRDFRVVVMRNEIPVVFIKTFSTNDTFFHQTGKMSAIIVDVNDYFSKQEIENILIFCNKLGVDYGELDILRSNETDMMYIVDVNPTPGDHLLFIVKDSTEILANHFKRIFLNGL